MSLASLEGLVLVQLHQTALVLEDVSAVSSLTGEDVVAVPLLTIGAQLGIGNQLHSAVLNFQVTLQAAQLANSVVGAGEDVEVIAVAVGASTLFALPQVEVLGAGDHDVVVDDVLSGIHQIAADLLQTLDLVVLHDDVLAPGEELVVNDLPAGGHGEHSVIGLGTDSPVGTADADEGDSLLLEQTGIQTLLALLLQLAIQHQQHTGIMAGAHTVGDGMEQAGTAGLEDGVNDQNAVSLNQLVVKSGEIVLTSADHALAHDQTTGASHAAGAVVNVPVMQMDKLDLGTLLLSGLQSHAAHSIVVTVLSTQGNTQNFHSIVPPKSICLHGIPATSCSFIIIKYMIFGYM